MARYDFGGTLADFVVTSRHLGGLDVLGLSAATLTFWSAQAGGTRYTDLVLNGSAVSSIVVGADGQVPKFQGPDGVTEMWADAGGGVRVRIVSQGIPGPAGPGAADADIAGYVTGTGPTGVALKAGFVARLSPLGPGISDSARIQAALDAANAAGGGTVYLGPGLFRVGTPLTIYSNVQLVGAGRHATQIKALNNSNLDAVIKTYQFDTLTGSNSSGGTMHVGITDLTIDGNKFNNTATSGAGIKHYGSLPIFERLVVRYCKSDGIVSEWSNTAVVEDGCEGSFNTVNVHDNGGSGVVWAGPHDTTWVHVIAFHNANKGLHIKHDAAIHVAVACHSWGNQTYAWYVEGESHLTNCQGEGASVAQLMIGANDVIVRGGKYFGFANTSVGIQVGDATHTSPTGVMIETKTANCPGGAVDFTYAGTNGYLDLFNFQTVAGPVLIAPANVRDTWYLRVNKSIGAGTLEAGDRFNVFDATIRGHITTGGTTPTVVVAGGAGTGATASVAGNDTAGTITITTGTAPTAGTQATITFATGYAATPKAVRFSPESGPGALAAPYTSGKGTSAVALGFAVAPTASTSYTLNYMVVA